MSFKKAPPLTKAQIESLLQHIDKELKALKEAPTITNIVAVHLTYQLKSCTGVTFLISITLSFTKYFSRCHPHSH